MNEGIRIIFLSVMIIMLGMLIGVTFYYVRNSEVINDSVNESMTDLNMDTKERKYYKYNGTNINGSDVVNAINELQDSIAIKVILNPDQPESAITTMVFKNRNRSLITDKTLPGYINPIYNFRGTILRDEDSTVIGIKFERIV